MFFEIFKNLCSTNQTTPTTVVKELGLSSSSATSWKQGKVPHHGTLIKIADYFDVSVDYLLGNTPIPKKEKPTAENGEPLLSKKEESVLELFRQVPESEQGSVMEALSASLVALGKVPEEQRELVARLIVASLHK
ncbi:MAG: hypothetical protein J6W28_02910 [Clostridia bacterium]|nr:hypothetical protein [Clostridia bacterium]